MPFVVYGCLEGSKYSLRRKFITCDIGLNSIETARDCLKNNGAKFDVLEVKDGVSLYRNPAQTMDNIKRVIKGLRNEDGLDKMWEGSINDSKYGLMPVYIPNLTDATTRILSKHLMRRIIHEAMPDLPENTKKVKVFYIDVEDLEEIKKFTASENYFPIEIEFQDLEPLLDNFIMADDARWTMAEVNEGVFSVWQVTIDSFHCDRILKKKDEYNLKTQEQMALATEDEKEKKTFTLLYREFVSIEKGTFTRHKRENVLSESGCFLRARGGVAKGKWSCA